MKSEPWPGDATLEVAKLWMQAESWDQQSVLDGRSVRQINSLLEPAGRVFGSPFRLAANLGKCFLGDQLNSLGFVLDSDEAQELLQLNPSNRDVVVPYLSGDDLATRPRLDPSRFVINFKDWPLERAEAYPECLAILSDRVKPEIGRKGGSSYKGWIDRWWQFWMYKSALHAQLEALPRLTVMAKVSKVAQPGMVSTGFVPTDKVIIFAFDDFQTFGVLSSSFHWWWTLTYASTLETRLSYNPSDVFETFPRPRWSRSGYSAEVEVRASALNDFRQGWMSRMDMGLTKTYNRMHDPDEHDAEIVQLRGLHAELDHAVREAYGWTDLALDHQHWETPQGVRFTVSPLAKSELLDRLLELNHERYTAEVAAGLHEKKRKGPARTGRSTKVSETGQEMLL
jgi:hypothetical protein